MKRKLISLLLAAALCAGVAPHAFAAPGLNNFAKEKEYNRTFTDVYSSRWYYANVKAAYEYGLMNGTGEGKFSPNGKLTVAETVAIACRLYSTYYDDGADFTVKQPEPDPEEPDPEEPDPEEPDPEEPDPEKPDPEEPDPEEPEVVIPWYQPYVDYAVEKGIIKTGEYSSMTASATRAQFAVILAASLPRRALSPINSVTVIPDVPRFDPWAEAVYLLYNAGVLTGSDAYGTFKPGSTITRAEVAAIVTRMADPTLRQRVELSGSGLGNFLRLQEYQDQFTDVAANSWYYANVKAAYELGLMNGSDEETFNPEGRLTLAETLAIACRLHSMYFGNGAEFAPVSPWYQPYVDYAAANGIYRAEGFVYYNGTATRAQFAAILAASMPEEALLPINAVTAIPDVSSYAPYAVAVYLLYNAGVLTGSDERGSFRPTGTITRAEVAAIVTRMADPSLRQSVTLETDRAKYRREEALLLNGYARQAAERTMEALNAANRSLSGEMADRLQSVDDAIAHAMAARSNLQRALSLMRVRTTLELSGSEYATADELVQACYDLTNAIDDLSVNEFNLEPVSQSLTAAAGEAAMLAGQFEKLTEELVNAFDQ